MTDLQKANIIGDPLFETNFLNASIWNEHRWVYTTSFTVPADESVGWTLVFDGIKMGARISLNGNLLAEVHNQFRRFEFDLNASVLATTEGAEQQLQVDFDPSIEMEGHRYMACTGGWDW